MVYVWCWSGWCFDCGVVLFGVDFVGGGRFDWCGSVDNSGLWFGVNFYFYYCCSWLFVVVILFIY